MQNSHWISSLLNHISYQPSLCSQSHVASHAPLIFPPCLALFILLSLYLSASAIHLLHFAQQLKLEGMIKASIIFFQFKACLILVIDVFSFTNRVVVSVLFVLNFKNNNFVVSFTRIVVFGLYWTKVNSLCLFLS